MKHIRFFILTISLFIVALATAQTRGVANNAIPGDNELRYYRFAIAIAPNSYTTDFGSNYENVKNFWQECEDFMNEVYVPLGMCFDVVIDQRLLLGTDLPDNNGLPEISGVTGLINTAISSDSYDVGLCISYRDDSEENTGLSAVNGAYSSTTKANGYAQADKWVVAHEAGHLFGADHTTEGEGSLMDNIGEFFSYPSIKKIRDASVSNGPGNAYKSEEVANNAPTFTAQMKDTYRIPKGACLSIPVYASDADGHSLRYAAIGCSSSTVGNITGGGTKPHFASLKPQASNIIDYRPEYTADGDYYYLPVDGTNIPSMSAGSYSIAILVNDMPEGNSYDYLNINPFYSNYSVWDATVEIVDGEPFTASISPVQNSYTAGSDVTVTWRVNNSVFTEASRVRITMSTDYGKTFNHVLADDVRALDGSKAVTLPNVNVGNVDVDFSSKYVNAVRSMRAGIIRVEIIDGAAYTLTTLSPENGGGFTVTGGSDAPDPTPTTHTVTTTANPAEGGTAKFAVGTGSEKTEGDVNNGELITLYAVANTGYTFVNWTLNSTEVSTDAICNVTASQAANYVANFEAKADEPEQPTDPLAGKYFRLKEKSTGTYMNIYDNSNHGTEARGGVNVTTKNESNDAQIFQFIESGTNYKLQSKTGYYIYCQSWNVDAHSTTSTNGTELTFEPTATELEYLINCEKGYFKIGPVDQNPSLGNFVYCDAPSNAAATWILEEVVYYTVTATAGEGGSVSPSTSTVEKGKSVTLTATPSDGYTFDGWYGSDDKLVSNENPYTFEVTGNIDYTAKFTQIPAGNTYKITVTRNNEGGLAFINDKDVTEGVYPEGDIITLYAVEDVNNSGYLFVGWYKNDEEVTTDKECVIEVEENATYTARFEKGCVVQALDKSRICQVTISDENGNFGTGRLVVKSGEKVTLSAYLDPGYIDRGYVFSGWEDINGNVVNEQQYIITVTQDVSYLAVVGLASYTLKVSTPDKNMGSVSAVSGAQAWGDEIEVAYMANAYLSAIPNDGYVFVNWTLNGEVVNLDEYPGTAHEYVLPAVTELDKMVDVVYVAHFKEKPNVTYEVSVMVYPDNNAGEVTFSKKEVEYGGSITLTATANTYYTFVNWTLDGKVVGTNPALTVNNVTQDLLYVANYKVEDPRHHRKYRLKVYNDGRYMNVKNHDGHGQKVSAGGVNVAAKVAGDSKAQIFFFEKNGDGYMLKDGDGYYIKGLEWSVDASSTTSGSVLFFEETNIKDVYYIKWNNSYKSDVGYFKVGADSNGAGDHPYCDVAEGNKETAAAKWVLEEVADKSKLVPLIAEATELFNQVATTDKTKIDIAGKITSNAPHNTADGNEAGYTDGEGYAGLIDNDPATYFHSRWGGTPVNEAHYLQINLGAGESLSDFCFEYAVRKAGSASNTSPAPTEIEVRVSADGSNFGNPVATYTSGTGTNSLPEYDDLGKTWMSNVISSQNNIRAIRLTVTNSAGPYTTTFEQYKFFAMGTLNLYSTQPSLKKEYKDYPAITEKLLVALNSALAYANSVNDDDAATTEMVNEAIQTLRAQKEALESALVPASFTLAQVTASNLMKKTEPTYIAVKNISGTNNYWFAGTSNKEEFLNSNVLVWEPVVEGKSGSYYIRNTYGKYIQNTTPISFGTVTNAAVFTAVNATSEGNGNAHFNGDSGNADTHANINTANDPNLVRFVTGTQWINVQTAGGSPTYNNGEGGYTVHFVYEATMVNEFTVNVTDAQFATFYAPVKVELPDNAKAYIINKIESHDWVSLAEVEGNVLPEKTAVILHSETPGDCKLAVTNETADAVVDGNKLLGTVNDAYVVKNSEKLYYILAKRNDAVGMYVPVLGENVNKFKNRANKAYLVLDEIEVPQMSAGFRFILPGATAVEEVTTDNADVETIYDLQGRKLTEIASPGIYIINGKKVFVK